MFPAPAALSVSQMCLFSFQQHLQQHGSSSVRPASPRMSSTHCRHFPGSTVQSAPPSQSRPLMQPPGYTMSLKDVPPGRRKQGHLRRNLPSVHRITGSALSSNFCLGVHRFPTGSATKESGIKRTWGSFKKRRPFTRLTRRETPPKLGVQGARPAARPHPALVSEASQLRDRSCPAAGPTEL